MKGRERRRRRGTARAGVAGVQEGETVSTGNGVGRKLEADPTTTTSTGAHVQADLDSSSGERSNPPFWAGALIPSAGVSRSG